MNDTFSCMFTCYKNLTSRSIFSSRCKGASPLSQSNIFHFYVFFGTNVDK